MAGTSNALAPQALAGKLMNHDTQRLWGGSVTASQLAVGSWQPGCDGRQQSHATEEALVRDAIVNVHRCSAQHVVDFGGCAAK